MEGEVGEQFQLNFNWKVSMTKLTLTEYLQWDGVLHSNFIHINLQQHSKLNWKKFDYFLCLTLLLEERAAALPLPVTLREKKF